MSPRCSQVRFGSFEFDLHTGELRKNGLKIRLAGQPAQVLTLLLDSPGKLVTREELQQCLWSSDTFVDFDHSLNAAVKRLREALSDSPDNPRFIETLPHHGYRFIAPIVELADRPLEPVASEQQETDAPPMITAMPHEESTRPSQVVSELPTEVERVVMRRLHRDPQRRWQGLANLKLILEDLKEEFSSGKLPLIVARHFSFGWLAFAITVLIASLMIGLAARKTTQHTPSFPVVKAVIKLEPAVWLDGIRSEFALQRPTRTAVAMSKDGGFIVYSAVAEDPGPQAKAQLYLRKIDQPEAKPIAGTEGGINPFLSPDDRWVGFWAGGRLMKISVDGGVPSTLCNARFPLLGASWLDNAIIFANDTNSGLFRVSAEGGEAETLTTPDKTKEEFSHRLPHFLPDAKGVLFTIMRDPWDLQPRIALLDLKTRKWQVLMTDAADARYVPTGHVVFLRQGTLMVVRFDLARREVTGHPVPAIANVMQALNLGNSDNNTAAGQFSISDSGWLVYAEGGILPDRQNSLAWVDHRGEAEPIVSFKAPFIAPRLSPDGQQIAYTTSGRDRQVWVYDLNRGTTSHLTREGKAIQVIWTPDGKRLVFAWLKTGVPNLYWQPADASAEMERLTTSDYWQFPASWSPDGATLAFEEYHPDTWGDLFLLDLQSRRTTPFLRSPGWELIPEFSPDGRWIAYTSSESGRTEVYVQSFPGTGGRWLISQEGGREPLWARDGKKLFYRTPDEGVWAVDVRVEGTFHASKARLLFKAPGFVRGAPIRTWDLSLDSQRFLMVKNDEAKPTPVTELVLVMNWFQDLQRLAPIGKK